MHHCCLMGNVQPERNADEKAGKEVWVGHLEARWLPGPAALEAKTLLGEPSCLSLAELVASETRSRDYGRERGGKGPPGLETKRPGIQEVTLGSSGKDRSLGKVNSLLCAQGDLGDHLVQGGTTCCLWSSVSAPRSSWPSGPQLDNKLQGRPPGHIPS